MWRRFCLVKFSEGFVRLGVKCNKVAQRYNKGAPMKLLTIILTLLFSASVFAGNGNAEMKELASIQRSSSSLSNAAKMAGFNIKKTNKPKIKKEYKAFREFLAKGEEQQRDYFDQVVASGEMDYLIGNGENQYPSKEELVKNAKKYFDVKYLFELSSFRKVFKDGEHVGYIFEINEYAHGSLIQDGAWTDVLVDTDFNLILVDEQTS